MSAAFALLPDSAQAAGSYLRPCGNVRISSSWQDHRNRTPPSGEPGTDYAVGTGTPVLAAANGTIRFIKTDTSTATGRVVGMAHDDGNYSRHLHLSRIAVSTGQRVSRGPTIAYSGASAHGSDSGVGPHVHTSRLVSYLVRSTPPGNVRVSTRVRFTQLSRAAKNGVPPPTRIRFVRRPSAQSLDQDAELVPSVPGVDRWRLRSQRACRSA